MLFRSTKPIVDQISVVVMQHDDARESIIVLVGCGTSGALYALGRCRKVAIDEAEGESESEE